MYVFNNYDPSFYKLGKYQMFCESVSPTMTANRFPFTIFLTNGATQLIAVGSHTLFFGEDKERVQTNSLRFSNVLILQNYKL